MRKNLLVIVMICILCGNCKVRAGENVKGMVKVEGDDTVSTFYISDHEVTFGEWRKVMNSNPQIIQDIFDVYDKDEDEYKLAVKSTGDNKPVLCVCWYDAVEYCNKLSLQEGLTPCYTISSKMVDFWLKHGMDKDSIQRRLDSLDNEQKWNKGWYVIWDKSANGYRLPTETEWEYAAKGGKKTKGYTYSGSNKIETVAWFYDNAYRDLEESDPNYGTHNVKTKKANELGLYDMSGNVSEWCWDWYDDMWSSNRCKDYDGSESGEERVVRGGSYQDIEDACGTLCRDNSLRPNNEGNSDVGFRRHKFNAHIKPNDVGDGDVGFRVVRSFNR